ncbi:MAG: HINT domain-containing protein [Myxococcota bacterium]|nr:HINT domain-containing protein [Myxococcota bacterium]
MVETENGLRAIETIEAGERVLALDERTGEQGFYLVTHTTIREGQPVIALELIGDDETELVEATGEHPFWVRDQGWVEARHLERGDEVFTSRGGWIRIGGGTWLDREQTAYNLDVEEADTYFVGEAGAWVHNNGCGAGRAGRDPSRIYSTRELIRRTLSPARITTSLRYSIRKSSNKACEPLRRISGDIRGRD